MSAESQLAADRDREGEKKSDGRAKDRSDGETRLGGRLRSALVNPAVQTRPW